jgi:hypothetical protein
MNKLLTKFNETDQKAAAETPSTVDDHNRRTSASAG